MLWEALTATQFEQVVADSQGVCILPIGVIEKHGSHLPLGTDMYAAREIAIAAAKQEKAIVFPYYFMGQIAEARHCPGTICLSHKLLMENLREICDEISRNGLKKILILNGHGGNNHFLPFFAQEQPRLDRDYSVYIRNAGRLSEEQHKALSQEFGTSQWGAHAGFAETAKLMHMSPELVHPAQQPMEEGDSLNRLPAMEEHGVFTGFNWYADFPYHFAGDFSLATPEFGKRLFDTAVQNTAKAIKAIKDDNISPALVAEYVEYGNAPSSKITHK